MTEPAKNTESKTPGEVAWFACWKAEGLSPNQQEWEQERQHNQSTFAAIEAAVRAEFEPRLLERIAVLEAKVDDLETENGRLARQLLPFLGIK